MNEPGSYEAQWGIDIDAASVVDAAQQALAIQRDPESIATVFIITDADGGRYEVDLSGGGSLKVAPPERRYLLVDGRVPIGLYSDVDKAKGPYTDVKWTWVAGLRMWETYRNGERLGIYEMDVDT